jgi:hypothetical protein
MGNAAFTERRAGRHTTTAARGDAVSRESIRRANGANFAATCLPAWQSHASPIGQALAGIPAGGGETAARQKWRR